MKLLTILEGKNAHVSVSLNCNECLAQVRVLEMLISRRPLVAFKVMTMKSLVVYYSRNGNSKFIAQKIAEKLGADTEEIIDKKNRRGWIGFLTAGRDATQGKET
jgi:hypothetical protein